MKLLAISDAYLPVRFLEQGLRPLQDLGVELQFREWKHDSLEDLQQANLEIERHGPDAVALPAGLLNDLDDVQLLVVQFAPVGRQILQAAKSLRVIGVLRSGTEGIDVRGASERGISVLNTPGRNARAVAECTLGLMLAESRNIGRAHAALIHGEWRRDFPNSDAIPELYQTTVGLVGYGSVGQFVAGYLHAFGSRILAFDPYFAGEAAPAELVDLPTLLAQSDIVSLHARLTDESYHLIGREELASMKPTAILINTARGGLVDEKALVEALASRRLRGAALDVFDEEPLHADSPLLRLDNVTLTPHLAGSSIGAFRGSPRLLALHFSRMLRGDPNLPVVNGIRPDLPSRASASPWARQAARSKPAAKEG
jgi:D-3-phosphoglycerate dehydrogenase